PSCCVARTEELSPWPLASLLNAALAISCETVALASSTSSQTQTSFRPPRTSAACGSNPSTTRPRPRLSALVSACKRVSVSGKRSKPTVPARKNNAPAETARIVTMSRAVLIMSQWFNVSGSQVGRSLLDERDGSEGGQQRERQRDVD